MILSKNTEPAHSSCVIARCALILVFFTFGINSFAQVFTSTSSYRQNGSAQPTPYMQQDREGMQADAQQEAQYNSYQSTIYEPFENFTPSELGADDGIAKAEDRVVLGFISPSDPGSENVGEGSPVGEPFILLLFAAVAAVVVAWRQKKPTQPLEGKKYKDN